MGMLLNRHRVDTMAQNQKVLGEVKAEEIPFTEPEEPIETPVEKPEKKPARKPATVTRRRKPVK